MVNGKGAYTTPGHDCPGLIEAMRFMHVASVIDVATPGHDCPGLIEARDPFIIAHELVDGPLRGMIAPASLKPRPRKEHS